MPKFKFQNHPDSEFKRAVALDVGCCLTKTGRIARSRYGCQFYDVALRAWATNAAVSMTGTYSCLTLENMSRHSGFSAWPYAVQKLLFAEPIENSVYAASSCFKILDREAEAITPETAYYVFRRYKEIDIFQNYRRAYEIKAQPLLSLSSIPESASLDLVRKRVNTAIAENGRVLHEKYGTVDPKPYAPPTVETHEPL